MRLVNGIAPNTLPCISSLLDNAAPIFLEMYCEPANVMLLDGSPLFI